MQRQLINDIQYALQHQPLILVLNTAMGVFTGAVVGAIIHDLTNIPYMYAAEQFMKTHAPDYNCQVTGSLFDAFKIKCDSTHGKKALSLATKFYGNTLGNSSDFSSDYKIIAQCIMIGAVLGFYLGVEKANEVRLSSNRNSMYYPVGQIDRPANGAPRIRR